MAVGCLLAAILGEAVARGLAWSRDRQSVERLTEQGRPVRGSRVPLGRLLRPSRNPRIVYELFPELDVIFRLPAGVESRVQTNAAGFRSPEYRAAGLPGVRRVVGIGDSLMFGWGVEQHETYLSRLEALLNGSTRGARWEIVNTAVPGYNTVMEVETLQAKGLAYAPEWVVVGFCPNDASLPNFIRVRQDLWDPRHAFLLDLVRRRGVFAPMTGDALVAAPRRGDDHAFEDDPTRVPPAYRGLAGWDALEASLRRLAQLSSEHHFRVVVIAFVPGEGDPRKGRGLEIARRIGLPVIDLGPEQQAHLDALAASYAESDLIVSPLDAHPSPLSHEMAAQALFRFIVDAPPPPRG